MTESYIRAKKRHRGLDPFTTVQRARGWTREHWDAIRLSYESKLARQWCAGNLDG